MIRLAFPLWFAAALPALAAPDTIAVMQIAPESFVQTVAAANAFEIRSSQLAQERATQPALKEFAAQMIADHRKAGDALRAAAGDIAVPSELPPKQAGMIALLETAEGADFDRLYTEMQAGAHAEAVTLFATFAAGGGDSALHRFARDTLPVLEGHKAHIDGIVAGP